MSQTSTESIRLFSKIKNKLKKRGDYNYYLNIAVKGKKSLF